MSAPDLRGLIQTGYDILSTAINTKTKKILAQIGNAVGQTVDSDSVEWWQHVGFASRPPKPEAGKQAGQCVVIRGNHDIAIASQDLRGLELYGNLDHGETCVYSPGSDGNAQARVLLKKDGSINLYTRKGNSPAGAGMIVQVDASNGAIRLINDKGYGIIIDSDGVKITAGDSALKVNGDGSTSLVGKGQCQIDGSGICLGSTAVPGVNSALTGVTGLVGVASTKVLIATA